MAAKKTAKKMTITYPNGSTEIRNTTATYTHVLAVFATAWDGTEPKWGVWSQHKTEAAAFKAQQAKRSPHLYHILPVVIAD